MAVVILDIISVISARLRLYIAYSHTLCDDAVFMTCNVARRYRLLAVWPHAPAVPCRYYSVWNSNFTYLYSWAGKKHRNLFFTGCYSRQPE